MVGNKDCVLQGNKNTPSPVLTISSDKLDKVLKKKTQLYMLQCYELKRIDQDPKGK